MAITGGVASGHSGGGGILNEGDLSLAFEYHRPDAIGTHDNSRSFFLDSNYSRRWEGRTRDDAYAFAHPFSRPVIGDFNGDGLDEIGSHTGNQFYLDMNGNGQWDGKAGDKLCTFATRSCTPLAGDWNGDGTDEIGAYRAGHFYLDTNGNGTWDGRAGGDTHYRFGDPAATALAGDFNGDGIDEIGAHLGNQFRLDYNGNGWWDGPAKGDRRYFFGHVGDTPITGDFNGDGFDEIGVHRDVTFFYDMNGDGRFLPHTGDVQHDFLHHANTPIVGRWPTNPMNLDGHAPVREPGPIIYLHAATEGESGNPPPRAIDEAFVQLGEEADNGPPLTDLL